jgi:hypothetical protein
MVAIVEWTMIAQGRARLSSEILIRLSPADDKNEARALRKQRMPVKPHAQPCRILEQIIEDLPSGLTLLFEAFEGGTRLLIGGRALRGGNREVIFDPHGALLRVGAYDGEWPPSWLSRVV